MSTESITPVVTESPKPGRRIFASAPGGTIYWGSLGVSFFPGREFIADKPEPHGPPAPDQPAGKQYVQNFERFAALLPVRSHYVPPRLLDRVPPPPRPENEIIEWYCDYKRLRPTAREQQYAYLEQGVVSWLMDRRERPAIELRGKLALGLICEAGLWKEFVFQNTSKKCFHTANEFVRCFLAMWGFGHSDSRASCLLRSTRLWFRLEDAGLPPPPNLGRLERLARYADPQEIYKSLVIEGNGAVPTELIINGVLDRREGRRKKTKLRRAKMSEVKSIVRDMDQLLALVPDSPGLAQLKTKYAELQALFPTDLTALATSAVTRQPLARYDPNLGCPFEIEWNEAENAMTLKVAPLPEHLVRRVKKEFTRKGWEWAGRGAEFWVTLELPGNDRDRAHAMRQHVHGWAAKFCRKIGAPVPESPAKIIS